MVAEKLDLAKSDKRYYSAKTQPEIVDFGSYPYVTISGQCAPDDERFMAAIEKLYKVSYTIKFTQKAEDLDFKVPKMEGEWWIAGGIDKQQDFVNTPQSEWHWRLMIRMPISVSEPVFRQAKEIAQEKAKGMDLSVVKYEVVNQGKCIQCMHHGSYDEEGPTVDKILTMMKASGLSPKGYHKEIYISDPRRTPEERLKTIIRHPVK